MGNTLACYPATCCWSFLLCCDVAATIVFFLVTRSNASQAPGFDLCSCELVFMASCRSLSASSSSSMSILVFADGSHDQQNLEIDIMGTGRPFVAQAPVITKTPPATDEWTNLKRRCRGYCHCMGPYVSHHFLAAQRSRRNSHGLHVWAGRYSAWSLVSHTCHSPGHVCLSLSDRAHDALCILPPCQGALWAPLERVGRPPCCHGSTTTLEMLL